ncbi:lysylphosphatidylglycerol synthase transmembrane domain-containing protein [Micromonospora sp. KC213]|uniref:lysylphosphatidylglycerol synthase transmembrane domain-containing protein n=1 Tax=Micromonospora sp. KC213 TaxID=2530378 RepID=UPI00104DFABF|nr:lysylphosphatidylglycerol synthase transmembrane domain-containing protein [Micromonospora sp. KC213]TDC42162.1 flippase-like domain-containing protein [Micromonospora sp. KC213]
MSGRRSWRRVLRVALTVAFVAAVVGGVALALRGQQWSTLGRLLRPETIPWLLGALLVTSVGLLCGTRAWLLTLAAVGSPVPTGAGIRMFFVGFLGKFVPGRVWGLLAQIRLGEKAGVSRARMAGTYLVNLVVVLLTGGAVGLLVAPAVLDSGLAWLVVPVALLAVLAGWPGVIDTLVGLAARVTRRPRPAALDRPADVRRSIAYQSLSWVLSGVHLWIVAVLLGADAGAALPVAVGAFALATTAGTLALFAPDGAGVREVTLVAALATVLPLPAAVTAAIASRVLTTLAEVLTAAVALAAVSIRDRTRAAVPDRTRAATTAHRPAHPPTRRPAEPGARLTPTPG